MDKVIYSRFSNQRNKEHSIRTDICVDANGFRYIIKNPCCEESKPHVAKMSDNYKKLSEKFKHSSLKPNKCKMLEASAYFEFVNGNSMDAVLDDLFANNEVKKAKKLIKQYADTVRKVYGKADFKITDEFIHVFGNELESAAFNAELKGSECFDVDMIFPNILIEDKAWNVIDYEWTFDFSIPVNFLIFRAIYCYINDDEERRQFLGDDIFDELMISDEEIEAYVAMESHFQGYTKGDEKTLNDWLSDRKKDKTKSLSKLNLKDENTVQIYYDYGRDFNEADSRYVKLIKNAGVLSLDVTITEDVKRLRIDPTFCKSVVDIISFEAINKAGESIKVGEDAYYHNGSRLKDGSILFNNDDPQLYITLDLTEISSIKLEYKMEYVSDLTAALFDENLKEMNRLQGKIDGVLNSVSWKLTKPVRGVGKFIRKHKKLHALARKIKN